MFVNVLCATSPAILMGHMKTDVDGIRDAMLEVDDDKLPYDLLKQLLAFAPDEKEVSACKK